MADAITELQEMIAHQTVEILRLSDELYVQQKEILQLRKKVSHFEETLKSLSHLRSEEEETPPPHY